MSQESEIDRLRRSIVEQKRVRAEKLAVSKDEATRRGKEPFDFAVLESMCDTSHGGLRIPAEERYAEYEYMYYVDYPSCMTLKEFAEFVNVLNQW